MNNQPKRRSHQKPAPKTQRDTKRRIWNWLGFIAPAVVLAGIIAIGDNLAGSSVPSAEPGGHDPVVVATGEQLYQTKCSVCHGADLRGTNAGPPFLDVIYAPNHHADEAFQIAVVRGVTPHHWSFGAMPPIVGLSREDVAAIIAFVRTEQEEDGIFIDPSHS